MVLLRENVYHTMAMQTAGVPATELASWRQQLAPRYGSRLVDEGDRRILVIRVPRAEPDPVNDVEDAIEHLDADEVSKMTHCILVGDLRSAQVYAGPLQDLMQERQRFDSQQIQQLRKRLPAELTHELYRAEGDPRRRWRLAIRIPCDSIKELETRHLDQIADDLGTQLEGPRMQEVAAVYILADKDHVRLEGDHVVQEMRKTWADEDRRRRLIREREEAEAKRQREKEAERRKLLRELEQRMKPAPQAPRVGPMSTGRSAIRQMADAAAPLISVDASVSSSADPFRGHSPRGAAHQAVAAAVAKRDHTVDVLQDKVDGLTERASDLRPGEDVKDAVARKLSILGYDVLVDPDTDAPIDLAAERDRAPCHVVARVTERLTVADATALVELARTAPVDHVLCVADQVDDEARRRIAGSKVTWFRPRELRTLRL